MINYRRQSGREVKSQFFLLVEVSRQYKHNIDSEISSTLLAVSVYYIRILYQQHLANAITNAHTKSSMMNKSIKKPQPQPIT